MIHTTQLVCYACAALECGGFGWPYVSKFHIIDYVADVDARLIQLGVCFVGGWVGG